MKDWENWEIPGLRHDPCDTCKNDDMEKCKKCPYYWNNH